MADLLATKSLDVLMSEAKEEGEHTLKRALGAVNLVTLGIGAIIGAGIFVLTGAAAAQFAGPAIILSYILAGLACAFAGLCYAEFASLIPIAGSAYTYGYSTLGEIFAWIIGWDLILEYAFGAATVGSGWSGTVAALLSDFGITLSAKFTNTPGTPLVWFNDKWELLTSPDLVNMPKEAIAALPHTTAYLNLVAMIGVLAITAILVVGIKESANFNTGIVFVKLFAVVVFIGVAAYYVLNHPAEAKANWTPFMPPEESHGVYGWSGIVRGAGVVFFAYIGFDAVSTAAQEAKNPQRDMPIGILGSLVICTILYIVVSGLLTAGIPYKSLNVPAPVSLAMHKFGIGWGSLLVDAGAFAGLTTVMLVMLLGQSRVFYSMSKDGLLWKWAGDIHPKFRTPWISTMVVGVIVAIFAATVPIGDLGEMVSIGTLLAFAIVSAGVLILRRKRPDLPRPFKTPFVPVVPLLAIGLCGYLMWGLPAITWYRLIIWLIIGMVIYVSYGRFHSKVQLALKK